jgi:peptidyl-prolyl cis-trans isomerase SurA
MDQLLSILDTNASNINKSWSDSIPNNFLDKDIFSMDKKNYKLKTFIDLMNTQSNLRGFAINEEGIIRAIKKILEPDVIAFATKNLENEFPDFKQTLNEFNDGVLLFKAETMEVWNKVKFDSLRAKKYYEKNKTKYITDPTYDISEIYVLSDSLAQEIYKGVLKGENFDTLASKLTQRSGFREKSGYMGKVSGNTNKFGKILKEKQITSSIIVSPQQIENGFTIIKVNSYEAPRQKTFEEAIPDFASKMQEEYQKELSGNWIRKLRTIFNVKVDKNNLKKVMEKNKN